ncbi:MAG: hypothetical protein M1557_01640, partial [Actinobacteria bacterium]|nr:hypothetical protein [Actinomycetota bacterium]
MNRVTRSSYTREFAESQSPNPKAGLGWFVWEREDPRTRGTVLLAMVSRVEYDRSHPRRPVHNHVADILT